MNKDGARFIPAEGQSMGPAYAKAEAFLVRPVDPARIRPGALVAFQVKNSQPVLHRLIVKQRRKGVLYFLTKGDGTPHFDQAWPAEQLIGEAQAMIKGEALEPLEGAGFWLRAKWQVLRGLVGLIRLRLTQ